MAEAGHRGGAHSAGDAQRHGRQERFHRTLKQHTGESAGSQSASTTASVRLFCREYNEERPHQALGQQVPASIYRPSDRVYPSQLPEVEYPASFLRRKVGARGEIYWRGARIFVSEVLQGEPLGLEAIEDGVYRVWFSSLQLGWFDERRKKLAPLSRRRDNGASGSASAQVSNDSEPTTSTTNNREPTNDSEPILTKPTKGGNLFTM